MWYFDGRAFLLNAAALTVSLSAVARMSDKEARTIFENCERPVRDYLLAIALFANGSKRISALQLSRDLLSVQDGICACPQVARSNRIRTNIRYGPCCA